MPGFVPGIFFQSTIHLLFLIASSIIPSVIGGYRSRIFFAQRERGRTEMMSASIPNRDGKYLAGETPEKST
jgi:hypothetical protein